MTRSYRPGLPPPAGGEERGGATPAAVGKTGAEPRPSDAGRRQARWRSGAETGAGLRPERLVLVCGTGTEVGKTWVCSRLLRELRGRGLSVAARKPAQSFDIDSDGERLGGPTDAEVLGAASDEDPEQGVPHFRSYHRAMAPPMAAEALGLPPFTVADLMEEMEWPPDRVAGGPGGDGRRGALAPGLGRRHHRRAGGAGPRRGGAGGRRRAGHHQRGPDVDGRPGHGDRVDARRPHRGGPRPVRRPSRHPPPQPPWLADRLGYRVVTLPGEESRWPTWPTGRRRRLTGPAVTASRPSSPAASTTARLKGRARARSSAHPSSPSAS